jgi:preprotein translocase subunit SecE
LWVRVPPALRPIPLKAVALNRQTKRMMKRQETPAPSAPAERRRPAPPSPNRERTSVPQFLQEVKGELRKVAWPTRAEVINSTGVVLVAVVIMTSLIFGLDWTFGKFVFFLYD